MCDYASSSGGGKKKGNEGAQSLLLYEDEASFFSRAGLLEQFRSGDLRPCDLLGRIYVLRFIAALGIMLTQEPPSSTASASDASSSGTPGLRSRRSGGSSATSSRGSSSSSSGSGNNSVGGRAAWTYLRSEAVHAAVGDVLKELEGSYPLLVLPSAAL
jgi:hypothetical protein